jgi:hypothetical protein
MMGMAATGWTQVSSSTGCSAESKVATLGPCRYC